MPTQIINPNLHAILVHFPVAFLFAGTAIELFSFLWRRSSFRAAGRWMILIGALAAIPAATTGMFAARQVMDDPSSTSWADLKQHSKLNAEQWANLSRHVQLNSIATGVLALLLITWLGSSDRMRRRAHAIFLLVLLVAVGLISAGAWHGGELVYANSTGVGIVKGGWPSDDSSGAANDAKREATSSTTSADSGEKMQWAFDGLDKANSKFEKVAAPFDMHVFFAGCALAMAAATLGLSFRALCASSDEAEEVAASDDDIVNALAGRAGGVEKRSPLAAETSRRFQSSEFTIDPQPGVARFWLLAALLALLAILLGWMVAGPSSLSGAIEMLRSEVRNQFHTIMGVAILVLTLLLALATRFAPRNRILVGCFALLLLTAIAAQVWLGFLLTFDTAGGPINHLNTLTGQ